MTDTLDEQQVRKVAKLARLALEDDEVERFGRQLSEVLGFVSKLGELDLDPVEPMAHVADLTNVLREDVPGEALDVPTALKNAPGKMDAFFAVPKVLGDGSGA